MTPETPADTAPRGWAARFLDRIERVGNRLPDPAMLFVVLLLTVWALSWLLSGVDFDAIDPRNGEPTRIVNLLAGESLTAFMANMVRVFMAWFGHILGGPAIVTALVCAFFTTFTGGSGVTILALGAMLLPVLMAAKFSERHALGLITGAGSLGILFPPCLPLILYALIAQVPVKDMFLGGIVPGIVMVALVIAWGVWMGRHDQTERKPFDFRTCSRDQTQGGLGYGDWRSVVC